MDNDGARSREGISRRSLLATASAGLSLPMVGCIDRVQSAVNGGADGQLSVTITTVPADDDRETVRIARILEENLEDVGVDVSFDMRSRSEYLRAILIDHDYDLYVGRHPGGTDPDFLYETLYGDYANRREIGWQNPFGVTSRTLDSLLERQRTDPENRPATVQEILEWIDREQPFAPICVPQEYRLYRDGLFDDDRHFSHWTDYLGLETEGDEVTVSNTDSRPTRSLNPLAPEYHEDDRILGLLYDSLVAEVDGEYLPWLAEDLEWNDEGSRVTVTLREDLRWHDGTELDVDDVFFTYRLLGLDDKDLTPGSFSTPPRYRGAASIVDDVGPPLESNEDDDRQITFSLSSRGRDVGHRALTVPILPKHIWNDRAERADEVDIHPRTNGVIETSNVPAIGSGPYAFESQSDRDHLTLERFDETFSEEQFEEEYSHFTLREDVDLPQPTVEQLRFVNDPGSRSAVERVESGGADVTGPPLEAHATPREGELSDGVSRLESPSWTFYHLGFNHRRRPFNNTHCRRLVSRLLDRSSIAREIFNGHATPTATPVTSEWVPDDWIPDRLEWDQDDEDPLSGDFFDPDGDLDVEAVRASFERVGFRYDEEGRLLVPETW